MSGLPARRLKPADPAAITNGEWDTLNDRVLHLTTELTDMKKRLDESERKVHHIGVRMESFEDYMVRLRKRIFGE